MSGISVSHLRSFFNKKSYNMKLHLPKGLRTALLAVIGTAAVYTTTSQAAPAAVYEYIGVQQTQIRDQITSDDAPAHASENFDFRDTTTGEAINWNTTDWSLSIDAYNVKSYLDDDGESLLGVSFITNSGGTSVEESDTVRLNVPNSFRIYLSAQGRVRIIFSGEEADSVARDIALFRLEDYNWVTNPDAGDVSLRLNFSWDADGGLASFEKGGGNYGALTFHGAYLLDNESHNIISKIDCFYDGQTILNSYTMPEDFLSVTAPEKNPVDGGGVYPLANTGSTIKLTVETPGKEAAWSITGKTSLNYLLHGKDGVAYYGDSTKNQTRLMDTTDTVYFRGNNGVLWLTEGDYTYNQLTRVKTQITSNSPEASIGFAADKSCTLTIAKNVLHSTALSTGCGIRALGDGSVVFEVDTNAFDSSGVDHSTDGFTVFDVAAGARYLRFVEIGDNTKVDLKVIGNNVVTAVLGDGSIGSNASITRLRNNPDDNNLNGDLHVELFGSDDTRKTTYIGKLSNEDGNLDVKGVKTVNVKNEDGTVSTKQVVSRLRANELYARGDINIDAQVKVNNKVESVLSFNLKSGFLEAGSMDCGGNFNIGSEANPDVRLAVSENVTTKGNNAIYGTAVIGGQLDSTNAIFVHTDAAETASLSAGSIVAPSVQANNIAIKGNAQQALLSGGATINSKGIIAGTIEKDTGIYLNSEDVAVTANNIDGAGIYHGTINGTSTIILNMVTHENGTISINKKGTTATGKMTASSASLPDDYTLSVTDLTITNGLKFQNKDDNKGLNTEGETTLKDAIISLTEGTAESIKASSISLSSGYTLNDAELTATNGITMKDGATLNNVTAKSLLTTEGNATLSNVTIEEALTTSADSEVILDKVAIATKNNAFGGTDGKAFQADDTVNNITLSGTLTTTADDVTLNATAASIDAKNLTFTEAGNEYTILKSTDTNTVTGLDDASKIALYVSSYTWAKVETEGNKIVITGNKDEEGIKADLADTEARKDALEAIESATMAEDGVLTDLHDAMGDVLHKSNEQRQEILDAISGASTTALADSQRRGIMEVQGNLRNRIVQMGGNADWETAGIQAWAQADASFSSSDSGDDGPGYDYNTWGATVGANVDLSETVTVGMSFSASYGELDVDSADNASGNNDAYYVNLFARHQSGRWMQMLIFTAGMNDMDLERNVNGYTGEGSTDGTSFSAYYELGYTLGLNDEFTHILQPMVNARISSAKVDGYTEKGSIGDAALEYDGDSYVYGSVGIGVRYQGVIYESVYERNAVLELRAQVTQDFGDCTDEAGVRIGDGDLFTVTGTDTTGTGFDIGAGISAPIGLQTTLFADADVSIRPDYTGFRANVGLRYDF